MSDFEARRERLRRHLRKAGVEALLVSRGTNVSYLTGFTGDDSYLLVDRQGARVLSDPRFTTQLAEECPGVEVAIRQPGQSLVELTAEVCRASRVSRLAVEAESLSLATAEQLRGALPAIELHSTTGWVEAFREIKDRDEIRTLRQAVQLAERAFGVLRASLHRDLTEKRAADSLEHQIRLWGGQGTSFPTIVAAGPRAALPHARPTEAVLGGQELVLVDWGAVCGHYRSDLTRVLATARISPKLERVYGVVASAQAAAIAAIRPGVSCHEVDLAARRVIEEEGYGKHFGHGLGHGIGLDIHEGPRLAKNQLRPLKAGMVVTVEPGVYLPGWGGVRIEDDVLVTRDGQEVLSRLPRELEAMRVEL